MGADHITTDMDRDSLEHYLDLYSDHQRRLYLYINAMLPNPADADEVFQETNIIIWQKFDQFVTGTDFLAWAYRIAFLQVKDFRRRSKRKALHFSPDVLEQLESRLQPQEPYFEERRQALAECKQKLSRDDRQLVEQCYAPGVRVELVAQSLSRTATSVYRSLRRIRQSLLACIEHVVEPEA